MTGHRLKGYFLSRPRIARALSVEVATEEHKATLVTASVGAQKLVLAYRANRVVSAALATLIRTAVRHTIAPTLMQRRLLPPKLRPQPYGRWNDIGYVRCDFIANTSQGKDLNANVTLTRLMLCEFGKVGYRHIDMGTVSSPRLRRFFSVRPYPIIGADTKVRHMPFLPRNSGAPSIMREDRLRSSTKTVEEYLGPRYKLTRNGRSAISHALSLLRLRRKDEVFVTTTFETPYVSRCVTNTIAKVCVPKRRLTSRTRAMLAIHEFGVPHPRIFDLRTLSQERGIFLIEDCAHTIDSQIENRKVGFIGDIAIYSFPKLFSVRSGGALALRNKNLNLEADAKDPRRIHPIAREFQRQKGYATKRRRNFEYAADLFGLVALMPLFGPNKDVTPYVFPLVVSNPYTLSRGCSKLGIGCTVWHGNNLLALPIHQFMGEADVDVVFGVIKSLL